MSRYDDDVFRDECYDEFNDHGMIKDNPVNKIKLKGIGKTKLKSTKHNSTDSTDSTDSTNLTNSTEENYNLKSPIIKLTKEEIIAAKIADKKIKREEAIAKSKAEVAARIEKEATELRKKEAEADALKKDAEENEENHEDADEDDDDDDWETKHF